MPINSENLLNKFNNIIDSIDNEKKLYEAKNIFTKENIANLYLEMKNIPTDKKREFGQTLNSLKNSIEVIFAQKLNHINLMQEKKENIVNYNVFLNTYDMSKGSRHILSIVQNDIIAFFDNLNFEIIQGNEVVSTAENFDLLNFEENHVAREQKDSFYLDKKYMLRTHCTASTANIISKRNDEFKVLSYGNVYRNDDDDATHSHQFNQIDIVWGRRDLNIANLKWLIDSLLKHIFEDDSIKTRYRLSYFPFTEPSFEVDISCIYCAGKGCNICKHTKWIEILGAGMLHQNVLKYAGITFTDSVLAAGIGIDRVAMLKYKITDIRNLYNNDFRLIEQVRKNIEE